MQNAENERSSAPNLFVVKISYKKLLDEFIEPAESHNYVFAYPDNSSLVGAISFPHALQLEGFPQASGSIMVNACNTAESIKPSFFLSAWQ
jgi:hypothetical protein